MPPSATSIPAILKSLQDEWDAVMLHSFTLRQQLQTARQELSHALYQHDAACRVIARLNKEVTAAREALATLKPQAAPMMGSGTPQITSQVADPVVTGESQEVTGITEEIVEKLQEKATVLTQERKNGGDWNHGGDCGEAAGEGNSLDPREKETRKNCSRRIVQQREHETVQCQVQSPWSPLSIRTRNLGPGH